MNRPFHARAVCVRRCLWQCAERLAGCVGTVLLLTAPVDGLAQVYEFTTLAGEAPVTSRDGVGSHARFNRPKGLAVDGAGNIYVADAGNCTIRRISSANVVTTLAGLAGLRGHVDAGGNAARFSDPMGIAFDPRGNLLVADTSNRAIRQVTPSGAVSTWVRVPFLQGGIAADVNGNVYFVGGGVSAITPGGTITAVPSDAGSNIPNVPNGDPQFRTPWGVAINRSGELLLSWVHAVEVNAGHAGYRREFRGSAVLKVDAAGSLTTFAGALDRVGSADGVGSAARFHEPSDLATDPAGNTYVVDVRNNVVRKIAPNGSVTTLAGRAVTRGHVDGVGDAARFMGLNGIATDDHGNVYVSDVDIPAGDGWATIRKITPNGAVTTLAGAAAYDTNRDSIGSEARFAGLDAVAVDASGNVFVVDDYGRRLRKISPDGSVTTLTGLVDSTGRAVTLAAISAATVDREGNVIVAASQRIWRISLTGVATHLAGDDIGFLDGQGRAAKFRSPSSLATDARGNVFVADRMNNAIRKITPGGAVTTLGGAITEFGNTRSNLPFTRPEAVAVDRQGNLFVIESFDTVIKKISPGLAITTLAGELRSSENKDGVGPAARFQGPRGLAMDANDNLFVADLFTVRRITPDGVVTTIAGDATRAGSTDGAGSNARFRWASAVAVDASGNVYVADTQNGTIRKGVPLADPARLANVSVLATLGSGESVTVGTMVGGEGTAGTASLLARAAGLSLAPFGLTALLPDPRIELIRDGAVIAENDDWQNTADSRALASRVGAFPFGPSALKDSALELLSVPKANYTLLTSGAGATGGVVLVELYDTRPPGYSLAVPRLTNVSVLKQNGAGLTAGFIIKGEGTKTVLIRAVGPSLAAFGASGMLADPMLELFDGQSRRIATNDNWGGDPILSAAFARVGAFALAASASTDATLLATLPAGNYSVQVRSGEGANGLALVEIYEVP